MRAGDRAAGRAAWSGMGLATALIAVIAAVAMVVALRSARIVFIPVSAGLLIAVMVWPLHRRMSDRAPGWVSVLAVVSGLFVVIAGLVGLMWLAVSVGIERLSLTSSTLTGALDEARRWLERQGLPSQWIPRATVETAQQRISDGTFWRDAVRRLAAFLTSGLGAVMGVVTLVGLSIAVTAFALLEAPRWARATRLLLGEQRGRMVGRALAATSDQLRHYLVAKAITGAIAGVGTAVLCWIMGVPLAWLWGGLALVLNYIPNVGVFFSAVPPVLLAYSTLGVWEGTIVLGGLVVIEAVTANLISPLIEGRTLPLSPLGVFVALVFWAWLWGAPGAFLAVPMTLALRGGLRLAHRLRADERRRQRTVLPGPDAAHDGVRVSMPAMEP